MDTENRNKIINLGVFNFGWLATIIIGLIRNNPLEFHLIMGITVILFYLLSSTLFLWKFKFRDRSHMMKGVALMNIYPVLIIVFIIIYYCLERF
jgi:hypothetical protein